MNSRLSTALLVLIAALAVGELISSVIIWREDYPDSQPWFAVLFAALYGVAFLLVRGGRVTGGAILSGALFLFEIVSFPSWQKHGAFDWATDTVYAALSLAGLLTAIAVLVTRVSARRRVAR